MSDAREPFSNVVGFVPAELRGVFSSPLPGNGRPYGTIWGYGEAQTVESLQPEVRHFMPIIELAAGLGELTLQDPDEVLEVHIQQDHPNQISKSDTGWHNDGFGGCYRRLLVSDAFSTLHVVDGIEVPTPDYGMLVINGFADHAVQRSNDPAARRTLLRMTRRR